MHKERKEDSPKKVLRAARDEIRQAIDMLERGSTISAALKLLQLRWSLDRFLGENQQDQEG